VAKVTAHRLGALALFVGIWEVVGRLGLVHPMLLVPPSSVVEAIWRMIINESRIKDLFLHLQVTLVEIAIAYGIVMGVGLSFGFLCAEKRTLGDIFEPIATAFASIPNVLLYPAVYLLFGLGPPSKIVFAFLLGYFPVTANAIAGFRQVDRALIMLAKSLGAGRSAIYTKIIIPAAAPAIVAGLRMGLALTVVGVLAGEFLASYEGVGNLIGAATFQYLTPELFGLILIGAGIAIIGDQVFATLEGRVTTRP
jgi:NitT/TauT family transport system permease protein